MKRVDPVAKSTRVSASIKEPIRTARVHLSLIPRPPPDRPSRAMRNDGKVAPRRAAASHPPGVRGDPGEAQPVDSRETSRLAARRREEVDDPKRHCRNQNYRSRDQNERQVPGQREQCRPYLSRMKQGVPRIDAVDPAQKDPDGSEEGSDDVNRDDVPSNSRRPHVLAQQPQTQHVRLQTGQDVTGVQRKQPEQDDLHRRGCAHVPRKVHKVRHHVGRVRQEGNEKAEAQPPTDGAPVAGSKQHRSDRQRHEGEEQIPTHPVDVGGEEHPGFVDHATLPFKGI